MNNVAPSIWDSKEAAAFLEAVGLFDLNPHRCSALWPLIEQNAHLPLSDIM